MDGTPHVVRFDTTTLWHLDAAEWAPSTASKAVFVYCRLQCPVCPKADLPRVHSRRLRPSPNGCYGISALSLRLYVCRPDHLAPLLGVIGDEFPEIGRRACKRCAS